MLKKKVKWKAGDYFGVPLTDGSYALAQVIGAEPGAMNSVVCAFFLVKGQLGFVDVSSADAAHLISICFVTRDLLDSGDWPIILSGGVLATGDFIDLNGIRNSDYVGVKIIGSANIKRFMDACYGMFPWDGLHDKQYFDKILIDPSRKPALAVYKAKSQASN